MIGIKILVVANNCVPFKLANAICLRELLLELKKRLEIHIVSYGDNEGKYIQEAMQVVGIKKNILSKIRNKYVKKIESLLICSDVSLFSTKSLFNEVSDSLANGQYSALITSSGSLLPQIVGVKVKQLYPSIKWIAQFNDPFPEDNPIYNKRLRRCGLLNLTSKVLENADLIFMTKKLYDYYLEQKTDYSSKMSILDIPLFKNYSATNSISSINYNADKINLVYAGSISKQIRNPKYFFRLLKLLPPNKYHLHIIGGSRYLKKEISRNGLSNEVNFYGLLPRAEVLSFLSNADVLINIGNTLSYMVPSKIFEYMSTGLPVVSLVSIKNDSASSYLKNYPNSLIIDQRRSLVDNSQIFDDYCTKHNGKKLDFEEIEEIFRANTATYNAELLWKAIASLNGEVNEQ